MRPGDTVLETPDALWAPLEAALVDALPGRRVVPRTLAMPGLVPPRRLARPVEARAAEPASAAGRLAFLMSPREVPAPARDGTLVMFRAGGQEAEVEEVLRRVCVAGTPLDQVEVACAAPEYVPLVWEACQRHGLPLTSAPGLPVALTRPARALLAHCAWVEAGLPAAGLRRLLQSGDVRIDLEGGPTAGQAARLLARSAATWGRETYAPAMAALAASYRERASQVEADDETRARHLERAEQIERLGGWIADVVALVPVPGEDGMVPVDDTVAGCAALVAAHASRAGELDGEAGVALGESLDELRVLGGRRSLREVFGLVRHRVDGLAVGSDRARPGHLHVTALRDAGHAGRAHTFVVGLEEGRVLPALLEDGEPVSMVPARPDDALGEAGWWLARLRGAGASGQPAVHAASPWLARGERAEDARESDAFTVFDGLVRVAGARLDPRVSGAPIAPTTLEALARCPFAHFLRRGLGVKSIDEAEPERDRWLDGVTRGGMLHALYAAIVREARARGERVDLARHGARLREMAEARLAALRAEIPPPSGHAFERERREILSDLDLFLRLEAGDATRVPVGFEVAFGSRSGHDDEPLSQAGPVTLDLGEGIGLALRGSIDRIDRVGPHRYEVTDYKTGRHREGEFAGTFRGGRLLQHALYALAATQLHRRADPRAEVVASGYYQPTERGRGERVACPPVTPSQVAAVLRDLLDVLASGAFVHAAAEADCRYCDLRRACGRDPFARGKRELANEANAALAPHRRLAAHA